MKLNMKDIAKHQKDNKKNSNLMKVIAKHQLDKKKKSNLKKVETFFNKIQIKILKKQ